MPAGQLFENDPVTAWSAYSAAVEEIKQAMAAVRAARIEIEPSAPRAPARPWTPEQRSAYLRAVTAWYNLAQRRKDYEYACRAGFDPRDRR